mmetsp:Transcript_8044/g.10177  ORF Transcript_8044/g.10177 Transcript_8044/m.10177 type:complete len:180 (-) Transcript_8044:89-628(-)
MFSTLRCSRLLLPTTTRSSTSSCNYSSQRTHHHAMLRRWNSNNAKDNASKQQQSTTFLGRFLAPKTMPPRYTPKWYAEMMLICTVFGITGSTTMVVVRPAVTDVLKLEGNMRDGPWSYRICSLVIMTPIYATLLVCVGTVFGRHAYFRHFSVKMWSRFGVPPELMDKNFHKNAKNFKKW